MWTDFLFPKPSNLRIWRYTSSIKNPRHTKCYGNAQKYCQDMDSSCSALQWAKHWKLHLCCKDMTFYIIYKYYLFFNSNYVSLQGDSKVRHKLHVFILNSLLEMFQWEYWYSFQDGLQMPACFPHLRLWLYFVDSQDTLGVLVEKSTWLWDRQRAEKWLNYILCVKKGRRRLEPVLSWIPFCLLSYEQTLP